LDAKIKAKIFGLFIIILYAWINVGMAVAHEHLSCFEAGPISLLFSHGEAVNVSTSPANSLSPALAISGATIHVVWEESNRIYHRFYRDGVWSPIRSVAIGEQPAVATDAAGKLHVVFVNEFGGNYEIYHCQWNGTAWSLPRNVSNTSGVSSAPDIAVAPDGTLHVVWADNTPGYNVIYHAYWNGMYWINAPVPYAMGGAPALSVSKDAHVHIVWQDRDEAGAPYEIYYSQWNGTAWSLPENLSDSAMEQSIIPDIATDQYNEAHVVWQEKVNGRYAIYNTWGRVAFWSIPEQISGSDTEAYLPSVVVSRGNTVYVGWDEGVVALYRQRWVDSVQWSQLTAVVSSSTGVAGLQLATDVNNQLHAVWVAQVATGNGDVFYQRLSFELALPAIFKDYVY